MKIVHVNFGLQMGGLEAMLVDIVNEQCVRADLHLVLINEQIDAQLLAQIDSRVTVWRMGRPVGSRNPLYAAKLNALLYRLHPDVVHCHNHQIARLLWQRRGQRCLTIHDVQVPTNYFGRYDKLFAISDIVREDVRLRTGLNPHRIYNGIRTEAITPRRNYAHTRPFRIVQVSRLQHEKKGQHLLLQALHRLVYANHLTQLRVDFVGEGPSLGYLQQLASELGLTDYVAFVGLKSRTELYHLLHDYHLLVQPSLYEGFGLTVAEGMAAGLPVLVSDIDGPLELIDQERYGYSFRSGDAQHLAERIRNVVIQYESPSLQTVVTNARRRVHTLFNVRQTAEHYLKSYQ